MMSDKVAMVRYVTATVPREPAILKLWFPSLRSETKSCKRRSMNAALEAAYVLKAQGVPVRS
jgi:hypothetical protein